MRSPAPSGIRPHSQVLGYHFGAFRRHLILRPYSSNITKRLVKTPKVYFMDTGLAAYLCRWPSAETLERGAMDGAFLETYVVTEIVKSYFNAGKPVDLFYYRDIDKKEIDLLIAEGEKLYPIEIKKGKEPAKPDKNFGVLRQFKRRGTGDHPLHER